MKRKLSMVSLIICFLLALAISAAPYYLEEEVCRISLSFILTALTNFLVLTGGFFIAETVITHYVCQVIRNQTDPVSDRILARKYSMIFCALLISACWIPVLVALYPGTLINDSWGQLQQYIRFLNAENALHDHHPVLVTLILGKMILTVLKITGNMQSAFFIFVLIQAVFTSFAFSASVHYAYRKLKVGKHAALCMLFLYCFLPIFPVSVQTVSKDALSAWLFVLFELLFIEGIRTQGEVFSDLRYLLLVIVLGLLCSLTKKVNSYVIILSLAGMFVFIPKKRGWQIIPIIVIFVSMFVIMPKILRMNNIPFGGKQEMLSIPYQQTARYVKEYPDDITEEEYQSIDKLLTISDLAERYNAFNADPVKGYYEKGTKSMYINYIKAWITQGIRHPWCYIEAFNAMISGWFSFSEYDPLMSMDWHDQLDTTLIAEENAQRHGIFANTAESYIKFYHNLYKNSLLRILFSYNTYAVIIPAFTVSVLIGSKKQRRKRLWIVVLPVLFSLFLGCFLAAVSTHFEGRRYLYPLTYTMPVMLALCIFARKDELTLPENNKQNVESGILSENEENIGQIM